MIIVPGFLISILTFPGVIVHEAAHMLFCRWFGLAIFDVRFFQLKSPAGYVIHERVEDFNRSFAISMGPFLVNSVLCVLFCSVAFMPIWKLSVRDPVPWFFMWLGLSIGMHAFPSNEDLSHVFRKLGGALRGFNPLAVIGAPLVCVLYVLNFLRFFWVDLIYGAAIGILAPLAIFEALI